MGIDMIDLGPYKENEIYCGPSETMLAKLPDGCIDLTVTSPPYDNLREYEGFTLNWHEIIRQLYRVTKPGGVVVWVVADATIDGSETGTSFKQALWAMECGFRLHDTMIYQRHAQFPENGTRYYQAFEYMFIFSNGKPVTVNLLEDRKNIHGGKRISGTDRDADGTLRIASGAAAGRNYKYFGTRYNIWAYATGKNGTGDKLAHDSPAAFPEALARDHILSWSNTGDIVLDPFMGSGTTAKMAYQNERKYLGFDIARKYVDLAKKRVSWANPPLPIFAGQTSDL